VIKLTRQTTIEKHIILRFRNGTAIKALRIVIRDHKGDYRALLDISTSKLHRRRINERSFPRKIRPSVWELNAVVVVGGKRRAWPIPRFILILNFLIPSRPLSTTLKRSGLPSVTTVQLPLPSYHLIHPRFRLFGCRWRKKEEGKDWEQAQLSSRSLRGSIHFSGNVAGRPHLSFKSRAGGGLRYGDRPWTRDGGRQGSPPIYVYQAEICIHANYYTRLFPNFNDDSGFLSRRYLLTLVCVN